MPYSDAGLLLWCLNHSISKSVFWFKSSTPSLSFRNKEQLDKAQSNKKHSWSMGFKISKNVTPVHQMTEFMVQKNRILRIPQIWPSTKIFWPARRTPFPWTTMRGWHAFYPAITPTLWIRPSATTCWLRIPSIWPQRPATLESVTARWRFDWVFLAVNANKNFTHIKMKYKQELKIGFVFR